jgi:hypothetical protein
MRCEDFLKEWTASDELSEKAIEHLATCKQCQEKTEMYNSILAEIKEKKYTKEVNVADKVMTTILFGKKKNTKKLKLTITSLSMAASILLLLLTGKSIAYSNNINSENEIIAEMFADVYGNDMSITFDDYGYSDMVDYLVYYLDEEYIYNE